MNVSTSLDDDGSTRGSGVSGSLADDLSVGVRRDDARRSADGDGGGAIETRAPEGECVQASNGAGGVVGSGDGELSASDGGDGGGVTLASADSDVGVGGDGSVGGSQPAAGDVVGDVGVDARVSTDGDGVCVGSFTSGEFLELRTVEDDALRFGASVEELDVSEGRFGLVVEDTSDVEREARRSFPGEDFVASGETLGAEGSLDATASAVVCDSDAITSTGDSESSDVSTVGVGVQAVVFVVEVVFDAVVSVGVDKVGSEADHGPATLESGGDTVDGGVGFLEGEG